MHFLESTSTKKAIFWVGLVWLLATSLLLALTGWLYDYKKSDLSNRFDADVQRISNDLQRRFKMPVYGLMGARGVYAASKEVNRLEFQRYVASRDLPGEFPGVRGMGFIERVPLAQRAAFERAVRADGAANFKIKFFGVGSDMAADMYVIKYVEPLDRNRLALGLDVGSEPIQRSAAEQAARTGLPTLSGTVSFVQDNQTRPGFLLFVPVYRQGLPLDTPDQRAQALHGFTYAPIVLEELLEPASSSLLRSGLGISVLDPSAPSGKSQQLFAVGGVAQSPMFSREMPLNVLNSNLQLRFHTLPGFESELNLDLVYGLTGAGVLINTLLAAFLWLLWSGRQQAEKLAGRLTQDLQKLALVAKNTTNAVIMTDPQCRITWVNDGFTRISGYTLQEAQGKTPGEVLGSDKAPLETLETLRLAAERGEGCRVEILNRAKDGHEYWVDTEVQPLHDDEGSLTGFVEIGLDITQDRLNNERLVTALLEADEKQEALQASEARLRTLSELSAQWFWETDDQHRFTRFSSGDPQRLLELNATSLGKVIWELGGETVNTSWEDHRRTVERREPFRDFVFRHLIADGSFVYWSVSGAPWHNAQGRFVGYIGIGSDITQSKRNEMRIAQSEALLERTGQLAQVGAWRVEFLSGAVSWSSQTCRIHEVPEGHLPTFDEALGFYPPQARDDVQAAIQASISTGQGWDLQVPLITARGRHIWVRTIGQVERLNGQLVALLGGIQDITEQKAQADALRDAKVQAEQASQFKSQFLANMSHEIRTPMNAILGMLKLLDGTSMQPRQLDYVQKAEGAAKSLLGLINDILDFSKVEAGKMTLDLEPFDLDQMMRAIAVIFSSYAGAKPVEVLFDVDPQVPRRLVGDSLRLQQILINLGSNAIKFTPKGNVVLKVGLESWSDIGPAKVANVCFSVQDNGIGIAPENQDKIFTGFTQAEASTTRRFGGTGLGLAISQRLVGMMGGQMALESALGVGSTFSFTLPMSVAPAVDLPESRAQAELPLVATAPLQVLFVDDNPMALQLSARMGRSVGWHVQAATHGQAALELVEHHIQEGKPFQLLFIDCEMPGMDGWELASRVKDLAPNGLVIVMVTANGREALVRQTIEVQSLIDSYLVKPVTASMLVDAYQHAIHPDTASGNQRKTGGSLLRPLAGLRILVVEDNAINQQVAEELISGQGARVDLADNGQRGVEAVEASLIDGKRYHAILMDMQMPVMDGITATKHIRERLGEVDTPIIAMTANAMSSDRDMCLQAGMNDHIGKPFDLDQLVVTLLNWTKGGQETARVTASIDPDAPVGDAPEVGCDAAPLMNREAALKRIGGSESLLNRMCSQFLRETPALLEAFEEAMARGDAAQAQKALHTLKGVAATLGAERLACLARDCESACKAGQPFDVKNLNVAFEATRVAILEAGLPVPSVPVDSPAAAQQALPLTETERRLLAELLVLLKGADLGAFDVMDALKDLAPPTIGNRWQALENALESMDFETASTLVEKLLAVEQSL